MRRGFLFALTLSLGCGARSDLPCAGARCAAEPQDSSGGGQTDARCAEALEVAPPCEGTGQIWVSTDACIDDGGSADIGDRLEVFCVNNIARFCLSHEACPWRDGGATSDAVTCSTSGLSSPYMASTRSGCAGWEGHNLYCCSAEGQIGLAKP